MKSRHSHPYSIPSTPPATGVDKKFDPNWNKFRFLVYCDASHKISYSSNLNGVEDSHCGTQEKRVLRFSPTNRRFK